MLRLDQLMFLALVCFVCGFSGVDAAVHKTSSDIKVVLFAENFYRPVPNPSSADNDLDFDIKVMIDRPTPPKAKWPIALSHMDFRLKELHATLSHWEQEITKNTPHGSAPPALKILLGPEWYWRASTNGKSGWQYTEAERKQWVKAVRKMSKEFPSWLIVPGTIVYQLPIREGLKYLSKIGGFNPADEYKSAEHFAVNALYAFQAGHVVAQIVKGSGANSLGDAKGEYGDHNAISALHPHKSAQFARLASSQWHELVPSVNARMLLGENVFKVRTSDGRVVRVCVDICFDLEYCRAAFQHHQAPVEEMCDIHLESARGFDAGSRSDWGLMSHAFVKTGGFLAVADNMYIKSGASFDPNLHLRTFQFTAPRKGHVGLAFKEMDTSCVVTSDADPFHDFAKAGKPVPDAALKDRYAAVHKVGERISEDRKRFEYLFDLVFPYEFPQK